MRVRLSTTLIGATLASPSALDNSAACASRPTTRRGLFPDPIVMNDRPTLFLVPTLAVAVRGRDDGVAAGTG
jgi:hypothetical protein